MKYRSRTEIVATILDAASEGTTKTRIMYTSFLSYSQLKEYLAVLLENRLLEYDETSLEYRTTEKGKRLVEAYSKMGSMVSSDAVEMK